MKYKIGIFGSSSSGPADVFPKAAKLGQAIAKQPKDLIVETGACSGLPYAVAEVAHKAGVEVWGYSPARNLDEHKQMMAGDDETIYDKLIFTPADIPNIDSKRVRMKHRNVTSTSECGAGIIISGRWGSLNEFTNLVDMQKVVGVLAGSGGAADLLPGLIEKISKEGQGAVVFDADPVRLLEKVQAELKKL